MTEKILPLIASRARDRSGMKTLAFSLLPLLYDHFFQL
jgi:hypothetical protein